MRFLAIMGLVAMTSVLYAGTANRDPAIKNLRERFAAASAPDMDSLYGTYYYCKHLTAKAGEYGARNEFTSFKFGRKTDLGVDMLALYYYVSTQDYIDRWDEIVMVAGEGEVVGATNYGYYLSFKEDGKGNLLFEYSASYGRTGWFDPALSAQAQKMSDGNAVSEGFGFCKRKAATEPSLPPTN